MPTQLICTQCNGRYTANPTQGASHACPKCGVALIPTKTSRTAATVPIIRPSDAQGTAGSRTPSVAARYKSKKNNSMPILMACIFGATTCVLGCLLVLQSFDAPEIVQNESTVVKNDNGIDDLKMQLKTAKKRYAALKFTKDSREQELLNDIEALKLGVTKTQRTPKDDRTIVRVVKDPGKLATNEMSKIRRNLPGVTRIVKDGQADKKADKQPGVSSNGNVDELLSALVNHPIPESRAAAARQLADLQSNDHRISTAILRSVQTDSSPEVMMEAAKSLGRIPNLGDDRRRILAKLTDIITSSTSTNYRLIAGKSLIQIDGSGPNVRKIIKLALESERNFNTTWCLQNLWLLHSRGEDTKWIHSDLVKIAENMANSVIAGGRRYSMEKEYSNYSDVILHNLLLDTLEKIAVSDRALISHLNKYIRTELPVVSRDNSSADRLLTRYRLMIKRVDIEDKLPEVGQVSIIDAAKGGMFTGNETYRFNNKLRFRLLNKSDKAIKGFSYSAVFDVTKNHSLYRVDKSYGGLNLKSIHELDFLLKPGQEVIVSMPCGGISFSHRYAPEDIAVVDFNITKCKWVDY